MKTKVSFDNTKGQVILYKNKLEVRLADRDCLAELESTG